MSSQLSRRSFMKGVTAGAGFMAASAWLAGCAAAPAAAPVDTSQAGTTHEGVTLSVAGMSWMWEGTKPIYEEFLADTGMTLEVAAFQQQEITDKLMQAVATNTYFADLLGIESNVSADVWGAGACLEIPDHIVSDPAMDWEDVLPVYRDKILSWEGKLYGMPFDGDTHHMMYLHSLLENPDNQQKFTAEYGYDLDAATGPKTWDEHRDHAEFFTGWDWNEDGEDNFGFAHMMKRADTAFWGFVSRSTAYAKHPDDPGFFFDLETGAPRINSPAFVRALTEWKDEMQFAPPGVISYGWGEVIQASQAGRVAMNVGWDGVAMYGEGSTIKGQCSFNVLPGSFEVYNGVEGAWENRPDISYAPYLAFGGWLISVAKGTENPEAAFDLAKFLTDKEHGNRITFEGFKNPIRTSEVNDPTPWIEGKLQMSEQSATTYIRALNDTMTHPNLVLCLRMPGWTQYRDALELAVSKGLAGEADPQVALDEAAAAWTAIMERLGGVDRQLEYYKIHLGV